MWHIFSKAFNTLQIAVNFCVSAWQRGLTSHAISWTVSLSKQPHWITVSHLFIVKQNSKRTNDLSIVKQFSIAISDNRTLRVAARGWDVFTRWRFSRHWRDSFSKARFTFAVSWQRWTFTPILVFAYCCLLPSHHSPTLPVGRAGKHALRSFLHCCMRTSFVPCVLKNFWKNKKKNNVIPTIEIMSPIARQQKQRGPCGSNIAHAAEHPRRKWHTGVDKPQASRAVRKAHRYTAKIKCKTCLFVLSWVMYPCTCLTKL